MFWENARKKDRSFSLSCSAAVSYNDLRMAPAVNIGMYLDTLPEGKLPSACIGCGKCAQICPQGIDVPDVMHRFSEEAAKLPKWADICRERAQAQARLEKG